MFCNWIASCIISQVIPEKKQDMQTEVGQGTVLFVQWFVEFSANCLCHPLLRNQERVPVICRQSYAALSKVFEPGLANDNSWYEFVFRDVAGGLAWNRSYPTG